VPYRSAPQCRRLVLDLQADLQTVVSDRWLWRNRIAVLMTGSARRLRCAIAIERSEIHAQIFAGSRPMERLDAGGPGAAI